MSPLPERRLNFATVIGDVPVVVDGDGPPVLVVHGGPGFDHRYLRPHLSTVDANRSWIYYDQLGSRDDVGDDDLSAHAQVAELAGVIDAVRRWQAPPTIFAHSWGTYLLIECLRSANDVAVDGVILCNPMALSWDRFAQSGERLASRLDPETLQRIEELERMATDAAGVELMELALPAYVGDLRGNVPLQFPLYRSVVNEGVFATIEGFDQTAYVAHALPARALVIRGDRDFISTTETAELDGVAEVAVIADVGHFPFAENPPAFRKAIKRFLDSSEAAHR